MASYPHRARLIASVGIALSVVLAPARARPGAREDAPVLATVEVQTGHQDCAVDLDSGPPSMTGEGGLLTIGSVEPGDHYLHVSCPDSRNYALLISPSAGEVVRVRPAEQPAGPEAGMEAAEVKIRLRQLIQEAARLRARGRIEDAARHLRDARRLDPENSDLHRELGITFLLGKDWRRARIEMLEAIRHDPDDADAHNGLGYALEKMGQLEAATEAYRMAMKLDPTDSTYRRHYFDAVVRLAAKQAQVKK